MGKTELLQKLLGLVKLVRIETLDGLYEATLAVCKSKKRTGTRGKCEELKHMA